MLECFTPHVSAHRLLQTSVASGGCSLMPSAITVGQLLGSPAMAEPPHAAMGK